MKSELIEEKLIAIKEIKAEKKNVWSRLTIDKSRRKPRQFPSHSRSMSATKILGPRWKSARRNSRFKVSTAMTVKNDVF
jgi:hypothetical protein